MKTSLGWVLAMLVSAACSSKEPAAAPPAPAAKVAEPAPAPKAPPAAPAKDDDDDALMEHAAEQRIARELADDTKRVMGALSKKSAAKLAELAPAGAKISLVTSYAQSDEPTEESQTFTGGAALLEYTSTLLLTEMTVKDCDGSCCKLAPKYNDERKLGAQIREVCFGYDNGTSISKLTVVVDV